jgi:hypothetical protein
MGAPLPLQKTAQTSAPDLRALTERRSVANAALVPNAVSPTGHAVGTPSEPAG